MKMFFLVLMIMASNAQASDTVNEFESFISELKATYKTEAGIVQNIYHQDYILGEAYMSHPKGVSTEVVRKKAVDFFIGRHFENEKILKFKDETFTYKDGVYVWNRQAEHKGYEGEFYDHTAEFIYENGSFYIPPHFTYPSLEQLKELDKLDRIYSMYFVRGNVKDYEISINGKKQEIINKGITTIQLQDVVKGKNIIEFSFVKEEAQKNVSLGVSIVFIDRVEEDRKVKHESVIHLFGQALEIEEFFGSKDLNKTESKMKEVSSDKVTLLVDLH